jgi:acetyl-CoA carboxylase biotin carboxylase subunit
VNARIQVEHPVTEMVTGIDLVQQQLRVASGEQLGFQQKDIHLRGHAIECRINAEDPEANFRPSPGRIERFVAPGGPGVRFDSHAHAGYRIPPNYDSMIGKLIIYRPTRRQAIHAMANALEEFEVGGVKTIIPLHQRIMQHPDFIAGRVDTGFIERVLMPR